MLDNGIVHNFQSAYQVCENSHRVLSNQSGAILKLLRFDEMNFFIPNSSLVNNNFPISRNISSELFGALNSKLSNR